MPDDHSEVVPLLPIPNRTVKRLCADDSADSRVKVGHRQAVIATKARQKCRAFCFALPISRIVEHFTVEDCGSATDQFLRQPPHPRTQIFIREPVLLNHLKIGCASRPVQQLFE